MSVLFAPLQGLTDAVFRCAFEEVFGGIEEYVTPFVKLEKGEFRNRDVREIEAVEHENKTCLQVLVGAADEFRAVLDKLRLTTVRRVDINMGCPFPKVVNSGRGAALLATPKRVEAVLNVLEDYPEFVFSLKMRSGCDSSDELWDLLPILNDKKLFHVVLHPRTAVEGYEGRVNMETFKRFVSECALPIIYNGDICSLSDWLRLKEEYPQLKGVMIGRGLLARPYMLHDEWTKEEARRNLQLFYNKIYDEYARKLAGEVQILSKMQAYWAYLLPETDRKLKKKLLKTRNLASFEGYAQEALAKLGE